MTPVEKVIQIATNELNYLEKKTLSRLYEKEGNAGYNNYTKYWDMIAPDYQGQPWCACFVTWCFVQAFGKEKAKKMLRHYPFVYCPAMANLFTLHSNPQVGDVVLFYRGGTFAHTGIVVSVSGDYFQTIEGNTSSSGGIVPNGGGVFKKGYYNSSLPGTKFCRIDYSIAKPDVQFNLIPTELGLCATITASQLNVRELPSTDAEILAQHVAGDQVEVAAKTDNGWLKIEYPFGTGYICADYVTFWNKEEITQEEFNEFMDNYIKYRSSLAPAVWSTDARKYCEDVHLINGDTDGAKRYQMFLSREELAGILFSLHKENLI